MTVVRRLKLWLLCWRRTRLLHEIDLHSGHCRYCGRDLRPSR